MIPSWLFENQKRLHFKAPYCPKNKFYIHKCIDKLNSFTKNVITFSYSWITSKMKSLLPLKKRILHVHKVVYNGECICEKTYLGKTKINVEVRWVEDEAVKGTSEPAKHISKSSTHKFSWITLMHAPENWKKKRILETFLIKMQNATLMTIRTLEIYYYLEMVLHNRLYFIIFVTCALFTISDFTIISVIFFAIIMIFKINFFFIAIVISLKLFLILENATLITKSFVS